jgi:integrase/recombinase XerD
VQFVCKSRAIGAQLVDETCPDLGKVSGIILHLPEQHDTALTTTGEVGSVSVRQAQSDAQLIELWLHGRSRHTQRAYHADAERFIGSVPKTLHQITLADLQAFADRLASSELQPASRHRTLSSVKSLFSFGHRLGYLPFDVARPLRLPGIRNRLSERMLDESEVHRMIALEPNPRNSTLLTLLYAAGLRVSELCGLCWCDLQQRDEGGQITVHGKGEKTRTILLPSSVWAKLVVLRGEANDHEPVFRSRKRGALMPTQVWRIVVKAAQRADIPKEVSTHWLRHAHASHALDRGAPIHLVQGTLGHPSVATTGRYLHARPTDSSAKYLPL